MCFVQGNNFYKKKEYARAIECYNGALMGMPEEAAIYSNRSLCYLREREFEKSLEDAQMCIRLKPQVREERKRKRKRERKRASC